MSVAVFPHVKGRTDENGSLLITQETAGTPGPLQNLGNHKGISTSDAYLQTAEQAEGAAVTLTPFFNARGKVDESHFLQVGVVAEGATPGPLTDLANLKIATDENGYALIAIRAAGTPGPVRSLANLKCRTDENGSLLCAVGP
jgi:hypothetical protein